MTEIAAASGFGSTRRFNDAFRNTYGRSPRELRRRRADQAASLTLLLPYRRPFDLSWLCGFFAARAIPGVEVVHRDRYLRSAVIDGEACIVEVRGDDDDLVLTLHGGGTGSLLAVTQRVRALCDLDASPDDIARVLRRDNRLRGLLRRHPGVRVPGAWDGFELTVRAILGQQISVAAATTLAGRLAERYGTPLNVSVPGVDTPPQLLFPLPDKLARARMNKLGITTARIATIRQLARSVSDGSVSFDMSQQPAKFRRALTAIKGIGDWTAQYVAMRVLRDPDAFMPSDLGLLRGIRCDSQRTHETCRTTTNVRGMASVARLRRLVIVECRRQLRRVRNVLLSY